MVIKRLAIVGYGRAGKDTTGEYIGKLTSLRYVGSTSNIICPLIAAEQGITPEEAWNIRHDGDNRVFWYNRANEYRKDDPAKIIKASLDKGEIVIGIRDILELDAMKQQNLVDLIIWIERRVPMDVTVTFKRDDCDIIIENNGTIPELYARIEKFVKFAGLK